MTSQAPGIDTFPAEVTNVSRHGFWLLAEGEELFLSFESFPWFLDVRLSDLFEIEQPHPDHFRWPKLDIDLTCDSIRHPERYPLVSKHTMAAVHEPGSP
ncbi:MAG: hypothetical protein HY900_09750 [Deltaproteobacteria bacterium]|nr:hypothetical protein [Deltaproteobacteria bacterium]